MLAALVFPHWYKEDHQSIAALWHGSLRSNQKQWSLQSHHRYNFYVSVWIYISKEITNNNNIAFQSQARKSPSTYKMYMKLRCRTHHATYNCSRQGLSLRPTIFCSWFAGLVFIRKFFNARLACTSKTNCKNIHLKYGEMELNLQPYTICCI